MTLLRPHIVAAASLSRANRGWSNRPACTCPPPDVLVVVGAVRERPAKTATGHGAKDRERTPERTALDIQTEADDWPTCPRPRAP